MYECGKLLAIWASKRKKKKKKTAINIEKVPLNQLHALTASALVSKASRTTRGKRWDVRASSYLDGLGASYNKSTALRYIQAHILSKGGSVFKTPIVKTYNLLKKTQRTNSI